MWRSWPRARRLATRTLSLGSRCCFSATRTRATLPPTTLCATTPTARGRASSKTRRAALRRPTPVARRCTPTSSHATRHAAGAGAHGGAGPGAPAPGRRILLLPAGAAGAAKCAHGARTAYPGPQLPPGHARSCRPPLRGALSRRLPYAERGAAGAKGVGASPCVSIPTGD